MIIVRSKNHIPIRLTQERWSHIIRRHPELKNQKDKVLETITNPDLIQEGDLNDLLAIKHYIHTPLTTKYLVVVYKEIEKKEGFIITAYFTRFPSKGRKIKWRL